MIIGLAGLKGSGKDTVAAYLVKTYQFERKAFADPLKQSVAALFGIDFSDIEKMKNSPHSFVDLVTHREPGKANDEEHAKRMTFRKFLQLYGTESHRGVFGDDFWVDQTLPVGGYYRGRKIVVPDVRFPNEVERVHSLGGKVLLVDRMGCDASDVHPSENPFKLSFDRVIANHKTLEFLYNEIELTLESIL